MSKVYLVASLTPKNGMESEMETLLRGMCDPSRAEAGCDFYSLFKNPDGFHFIECWKSENDLDLHRETPHYKNFKEKIANLLDVPPNVLKLEDVNIDLK
tara:strand:+ start:7465 stop:7761 length:297 start_codon:yes stop_codon:yes gene_type:complete